MKWYKKQLDALRAAEPKSATDADEQIVRYPVNQKILKPTSVPSPVAESTRQRKKTDLY